MRGKSWTGIILAAALGLSLTAPATEAYAEEAASEEAKIVTISLAGGWASLNTISAMSDYQLWVLDLIFDPLLYMNQDGTVDGRLLESWEMNEDHTVLTGHLNEKAVWQDGEPLTAEDVVYTYSLRTDPELPSGSGISWIQGTNDTGRLAEGEELGVKALGDYDVEFDFKFPMTELSFASRTYDKYILPEHILGELSAEEVYNSDFFDAPIGSGQFRYVDQEVGVQLELAANESYFLGTPDIDQLYVKVISNENVLAALISGEVDVTTGNLLSDILISDVETAQLYDNFDVVVSENLGYLFAVINMKGALSDAGARRAIESAINKQSIVDDVLKGYGKVIYAPISDKSIYYSDDFTKNEYDPEAAKALLEEAGYDFDTTLTLRVTSGLTERERVAELIQQNLADIGVNVEIEKTDHATLQAETFKGNYDITLMSMPGTPWPDEAGQNWYFPYEGNFQQQDTDDLSIYQYWAAAAAELDVEKAVPLYAEAMNAAEEAATYLYLYNQNDIIGQSKRVTNVDRDSYYSADKVYLWKVE